MRHFRFLVMLCLAWISAPAQTAILVLDGFPPTGDGYSALQAGGAFPTGAASLYYNPALLAELERATGSAFHASGSQEHLWVGGSRNFAGFSATLPDAQGFDAGIGIFRNHFDYGDILVGSGGERSSYYEDVYALGAAIRLGVPVSLGGTVKFYDSHFSSDAYSTGWAFDVGLAANPRFTPFSPQGFTSLEVNPSVGVTLQNMGPDAFYTESSMADPIPFLSRSSLGAQALFADVVDFSFGWDLEKPMDRRSDGKVTDVEGVSLSVLGIRYGRAWRHTPSSSRQIHQSWAYEFNHLQVRRLVKRFQTLDFRSSSESIVKKSGVLNPGFTIGWRKFDSDWDHQDSWYFSVSL